MEKWTIERRSVLGRIKAKFRSQRLHAKRRGIVFQFTFDQWLCWWVEHLGVDWENKRGNKLGQYVMARKGDKGPYHPDNVLCLTNSDNSKMARDGEIQSAVQRAKNSAANRGIKNARCKLDEKAVIEIYNSKKKIAHLARFYKIDRAVIYRIKDGRNWTHVTGHK